MKRTPQITRIDPTSARLGLVQTFALVDKAGLVIAQSAVEKRLDTAHRKNPEAERVAIYATPLRKKQDR